MCKIFGKRFNDYFINKKTQAFLGFLANSLGLKVEDLVITRKGQGSWIHPKAAVHFATWLSPEFHLKVINWVYRYIVGDASLIDDVASRVENVNQEELKETKKRIKAAEQELEAATGRIAGLQEELIKTLDQNSDLEGRLVSTQSQVQLVQEEIERVETESDEVAKQLQESKKQKDEVGAEFNRVSLELKELKDSLDLMTRSRNRAEQDSAIYQKKYFEVEGAYTEIFNKYNTVKEKHAKVVDAYHNTNKLMGEAIKNYERGHHELTAIQEKEAKIKKQVLLLVSSTTITNYYYTITTTTTTITPTITTTSTRSWCSAVSTSNPNRRSQNSRRELTSPTRSWTRPRRTW
jgi:hypothetical protein